MSDSRKYKLQKHPVYENTDKRASEKWHYEEDKRKRARKLAEKLLGKNYFTNMQAVMLETAIELSERKNKNET
jgi:hypothetical protein|tara:strand:+ start:267 stop:485 length:219 start_codon:yes stop_codon:yes gene_type:complete